LSFINKGITALLQAVVESSAEQVTAKPPADSVAQQAADGWQASLELLFKCNPLRTVLQTVNHRGPLRVQRPFYPEGSVCHVYLLHPPGGMVAGDNLAIAVDLQAGAQTLLTTPAAGKLYRVAKQASPQYQGVCAKLAAGSALEWLPQETILFNGARGELLNRFELTGDAVLIGWDIVCLGRRASGETFESGNLKQRIEILRDGRPVYIDRINFDGGSDMLSQPWGMAGHTVSGTFFATIMPDCKPSLDELRAQLAQSVTELGSWGLTLRGELLLARYLGDSAEHCRRGFECIWQQLRPLLVKRPMLRPRIWNT
jgi:urease accessory protein